MTADSKAIMLFISAAKRKGSGHTPELLICLILLLHDALHAVASSCPLRQNPRLRLGGQRLLLLLLIILVRPVLLGRIVFFFFTGIGILAAARTRFLPGIAATLVYHCSC